MSARTKKPAPVAIAPPAPSFPVENPYVILDRAARKPLKYSARLVSFHCYCGRPHDASTELVRCACGRGWIQEPAP